MPFAIIIIGAVLLVAGVRGTHKDLWTLVKGDFTGNSNFINWVAAIAVIGALGYIPKLKPLSIAFMTLLLLVLVISHGGLFAKLQSFIQGGLGSSSGTTAAPTQTAALSPLPSLATAEEQIAGHLSGALNG